MSSGDRVFLDFLEYDGTTLEDLVNTTQFEELNAKCESAALKITDQIFDYWTQNDELKIKVVLSEGKPGIRCRSMPARFRVPESRTACMASQCHSPNDLRASSGFSRFS